VKSVIAGEYTAPPAHGPRIAEICGIVKPDDRRANPHRGIHNRHNLGGIGLRQAAAEHGEVLREDEHHAPVDAAMSGDKAVARNHDVGETKVSRTRGHELACLFKRALVEQKFDAFAGQQLAGFLLASAAFRASASFGCCVAGVQFSKFVVVRMGVRHRG